MKNKLLNFLNSIYGLIFGLAFVSVSAVAILILSSSNLIHSSVFFSGVTMGAGWTIIIIILFFGEL